MRKKTNGCLKSGYLMRCNSLKNNILPFINAFGAAGDTQSSDRPIDDPLLLVIFHWIPSHTHSELLVASSAIIILIYHDIPTIKYLPNLYTHSKNQLGSIPHFIYPWHTHCESTPHVLHSLPGRGDFGLEEGQWVSGIYGRWVYFPSWNGDLIEFNMGINMD